VTTSDTLILNDENKVDASSEPQSDAMKLKQKLLTNSSSENGHSFDDTKNASYPMSNYCLRFADTNQIFPLAVGVNKIGRAESSDICIMNKGVSKSHACIELKQNRNNGELEECSIWSCSLVRTCLNQNRLNTDEKAQLVLDDLVQFANFKFLFCKMSELELKDQIVERAHVLDLTEKESSQNKSSNLFEIQNTLDEENEEKPLNTATNGDCDHQNSNGKSHQNGALSNGSSSIKQKHLYEEDTDPEEESEENCTADNLNNTTASAEFHLEMSQSFLVNQSVASNKTGCSFLVPETMVEEDEESFREEKTNNETESKTEESTCVVESKEEPVQVESTDDKKLEQEQQDRVNNSETPIQNVDKIEPVVETLSVVDNVTEEKVQESTVETVSVVEEQPPTTERKKRQQSMSKQNLNANQIMSNKILKKKRKILDL